MLLSPVRRTRSRDGSVENWRIWLQEMASLKLHGFNNRDLTGNDDGDGNENGKKKSNWFRLVKQQVCTCITLFLYISQPSLHDYNMKVPNFTFCRGRKHKRQQLSFSFPELWYSPLEFHPDKICHYIWRIRRDGISATKIEAVRIHFLSHVFVAVAIAVAVARVA